MTVSPAVPAVEIGVAASAARLPSEATKSCVFVACSVSGAVNTPVVKASGAAAQATFGIGKLSQMVYTHGALDPNRTPVMLARVPSTNPGVLHLDTSAVTGDAAVSVDPVLTPNNYYEPKFEVLTGGNVGVSPAGIIIRRSADEDRHYQDVELGLASVLEIPDTGIKIVFNVSTSATYPGHTIPSRTPRTPSRSRLRRIALRPLL
jgi:hypothetical protein